MDSGREYLLEFLNLLNSAMHIEQLLQISSDFFIRKFRLIDCYVKYGKSSHVQDILDVAAPAKQLMTFSFSSSR